MKRPLAAAVIAAVMSTMFLAPAVQAHEGHDQSPQAVAGVGVIRAIDLQAGTVTIAHTGVSALGWAAATARFRLENTAVVNGFSVGQRVHFELRNVDGRPVIAKLHHL